MAKKLLNKNLTVTLLVLVGLMGYSLLTKAGNLNPPASPAPTMKTLDEIFGTVDSLASGRLTYPEKLWIDHEFQAGGGASGPFLKLEIDGNYIEGESTIASMDREGTIQCGAFDHEVSVPYDAATAQTTGARVHGPISIIKRIDKTTPLLLKALCLNEPVDSAEFMFFRPATSGDGAEEKYLTILLENAKIVAIENAYPNVERVSFLSCKIRWTYEIGGAEFQDIIRPD